MRVPLLILSIVATSYLSISCLNWGAKNYQPNNGFTSLPPAIAINDLNSWSLIDIASSQLIKLREASDQQNGVLDYMAWQGERDKILRKQLITLQDLLNLEPTSTQDWLRLMAVQNELNLSVSELDFSLSKAIQGADWYIKSSPTIIHYCLVLDRRLSAEVRGLCDGVISSYPWRPDRRHQARGMRVSTHQLDQRLTQLAEAARLND